MSGVFPFRKCVSLGEQEGFGGYHIVIVLADVESVIDPTFSGLQATNQAQIPVTYETLVKRYANGDFV